MCMSIPIIIINACTLSSICRAFSPRDHAEWVSRLAYHYTWPLLFDILFFQECSQSLGFHETTRTKSTRSRETIGDWVWPHRYDWNGQSAQRSQSLRHCGATNGFYGTMIDQILLDEIWVLFQIYLQEWKEQPLIAFTPSAESGPPSDHTFLADCPLDVVKSNRFATQVPLMMGVNAQEGAYRAIRE